MTKTRISAGDRKALDFLIQSNAEGQQRAQQAQGILQDAARREAALQGYMTYLSMVYGIKPGEGISEDGTIVRNEEPEKPDKDEKKDAPTQ
jgi:hypothetical protein